MAIAQVFYTFQINIKQSCVYIYKIGKKIGKKIREIRRKFSVQFCLEFRNEF